MSVTGSPRLSLAKNWASAMPLPLAGAVIVSLSPSSVARSTSKPAGVKFAPERVFWPSRTRRCKGFSYGTWNKWGDPLAGGNRLCRESPCSPNVWVTVQLGDELSEVMTGHTGVNLGNKAGNACSLLWPQGHASEARSRRAAG